MSAIVAAATELFGKYGIEAVSMTMIATHSNISKPALYRYFPNKKSLVRELTNNWLDSIHEVLKNAVKQSSHLSLHEIIRKATVEHLALHRKEPHRNNLASAVLADPELAELNYQDLLKYAEIVQVLFKKFYPKLTDEELFRRAILVLQMGNALVPISAQMTEDEVPALIDSYMSLLNINNCHD